MVDHVSGDEVTSESCWLVSQDRLEKATDQGLIQARPLLLGDLGRPFVTKSNGELLGRSALHRNVGKLASTAGVLDVSTLSGRKVSGPGPHARQEFRESSEQVGKRPVLSHSAAFT